MNTLPTTLEVLYGTDVQTTGEFFLVKKLDGMKNLVAIASARLIKFFIMHPATELDDNCKLEQVYKAKRNRFCGRHIEFAVQNAEAKSGK